MGQGGGYRENHNKIKKRRMVQSHSENRWFLDVWNAAKESTSLAVFGRAFQSLGAELENALKPNFLVLFLFWCVF